MTLRLPRLWPVRTAPVAARAPVAVPQDSETPRVRSNEAHPGPSPTLRRSDAGAVGASLRLRDYPPALERIARLADARARRDGTTGLASRADLAAIARRYEGLGGDAADEVCVLCLDLDGIAAIDARLGPAAADHLRSQLAARLRHGVRAGDAALHAGGDALTVLMPCRTGEGAALARHAAERLLADLQRPLSYLTLTGLRIGCSVGGAIWIPGDESIDTAITRADGALRAACDAGRGQFRHAMRAVPVEPVRTVAHAEALCA